MSRSTISQFQLTERFPNAEAGEYVRGDVHTNGIESVWAVLNRGIHGTFHHISKKHTQRYVDEFAFRLSEGKVERHVLDKLDSFVHNVTDRRITYNQLTAKAAQ